MSVSMSAVTHRSKSNVVSEAVEHKRERKSSHHSIGGASNFFKMIFNSCLPCSSHETEELISVDSYYAPDPKIYGTELSTSNENLCYQTIYKTSGPILVWNSSQKIISANQAALDLFEYDSLEDLKNKHYNEVFSQVHDHTVKESLIDVELVTQHVDIAMFKGIAIGKRQFPVEVRETRVSKDGLLNTITTTLTDLSKMAQVSHELSETKGLLEQSNGQIKELKLSAILNIAKVESELVIPEIPKHLPNPSHKILKEKKIKVEAELNECKKEMELQRLALLISKGEATKYKEMFDRGLPSIIIDNSDRILESNQAIAELAKTDLSKITQLTLSDLFDLKTNVEGYGFFKEKDPQVTWYLGSLNKQSEKQFVAVRCVPIVNNEKRLLSFFDITTEQLLKKALKTFCEPYFYIRFDKMGVILDVLDTNNILGYDQNELVGTSCFLLTHPEDHNRMAEEKEPGQRLDIDQVRYKHKDGHFVNLEFVGIGIDNEIHSIARVVLED